MPLFLLCIFTIKASANENNYGCTSSVVPWIRDSDQDVVTRFIQETYPIDNPNNNDTGTEVAWRPRTMYTITQQLLRWDRRGPNEIFQHGFHPRRTGSHYDVNSANIWTYANVNNPSIFVGTTIVRDGENGAVSRWTPRNFREGTTYAYDVFAPGGISVNQSLGSSYRYRNQFEIAFPGGINRRYIRSVTQYFNGRVVRVFNNPYFAPGRRIPAKRSINRIPVIQWTENHKDGNNPDTSTRTNNDDLMFGGNGGENVDVPKDNEETKSIDNGIHQIGVPSRDEVVKQDLDSNSECTIANNQKDNTRWQFTYDVNKDAYSIKNYYTHSSLCKNEFWKAKEIENGMFILVNTDENTLLSRNGTDITEKKWNNAEEVPENCKWNVTDIDDQPIPGGSFYQISASSHQNSFLSSTSENQASPLAINPYGVDNRQIWKVNYDSDKKAYTLSTMEDNNKVLTWESTSGDKISNYSFEKNDDQYWYIRHNGSGYQFINYKDGYTKLSYDLKASRTASEQWTFKQFEDDPFNQGCAFISAKDHPNQVVDLPNNGYAPNLVSHAYTGAQNQIWAFSDRHNNVGLYPSNYYVKSINTDSHMMTWDNTKGSNIIGFDWDRNKINNDQKWRVIRDPSGYYRLHNAYNYNKVMTDQRNNNLQVSDYEYESSTPFAASNSNQLWNIAFTDQGSITDGHYVFASKSNYKNVIDFVRGKMRVLPYLGQSSSVFDCNFYSNERTNGRYRVSNGSSGSDGFSSEWILDYLPDKGAFTIRDFKTNDFITANGDHIKHENYDGSDSQLWYILQK